MDTFEGKDGIVLCGASAYEKKYYCTLASKTVFPRGIG